MFASRLSLWLLMGTSFLVAQVLSVYPLPFDWRWWRPEFVLVMAIFWMMHNPLTTSLVFIALVGLFQDLLEGVPFGQHSLGLLIVSYLCILSYQRVRNFPLWKQSCWVFVLVGISQLTDNWVQSMAGRQLSGLAFLYPAITSAVLWPLVQLSMDSLCRRYHVHS